MTLLDQTIAAITAPSAAVAARVQHALDFKTKPRGSLGRLEALAVWYASVRGDETPAPAQKAIVVMGGDHGVASEGVSAFPAEVTRQMLLNFAAGGAAINVLARQVGARVLVVDMGVREAVEDAPTIRQARVGAGTASFVRGPAMTSAQARQALEIGIAIARELAADGITLVGLGEMGIGNSTSAAALGAALLGVPASEMAGRGTGIDDAGLRRKIDVIERALVLHRPDAADPLAVLASLGGFEIAGLAGLTLGAAAAGIGVVVDGFIATAAALVATRLAPRVTPFLIAGHKSVEPGHTRMLAALGLRPCLDLELRLGEGTGAALCMGIVDAALAVLADMATFAAAGVSDSGR